MDNSVNPVTSEVQSQIQSQSQPQAQSKAQIPQDYKVNTLLWMVVLLVVVVIWMGGYVLGINSPQNKSGYQANVLTPTLSQTPKLIGVQTGTGEVQGNTMISPVILGRIYINTLNDLDYILIMIKKLEDGKMDIKVSDSQKITKPQAGVDYAYQFKGIDPNSMYSVSVTAYSEANPGRIYNIDPLACTGMLDSSLDSKSKNCITSIPGKADFMVSTDYPFGTQAPAPTSNQLPVISSMPVSSPSPAANSQPGFSISPTPAPLLYR